MITEESDEPMNKFDMMGGRRIGQKVEKKRTQTKAERILQYRRRGRREENMYS